MNGPQYECISQVVTMAQVDLTNQYLDLLKMCPTSRNITSRFPKRISWEIRNDQHQQIHDVRVYNTIYIYIFPGWWFEPL